LQNHKLGKGHHNRTQNILLQDHLPDHCLLNLKQAPPCINSCGRDYYKISYVIRLIFAFKNFLLHQPLWILHSEFTISMYFHSNAILFPSKYYCSFSVT
jgi:hypothetical protein